MHLYREYECYGKVYEFASFGDDSKEFGGSDLKEGTFRCFVCKEKGEKKRFFPLFSSRNICGTNILSIYRNENFTANPARKQFWRRIGRDTRKRNTKKARSSGVPTAKKHWRNVMKSTWRCITGIVVCFVKKYSRSQIAGNTR